MRACAPAPRSHSAEARAEVLSGRSKDGRKGRRRPRTRCPPHRSRRAPDAAGTSGRTPSRTQQYERHAELHDEGHDEGRAHDATDRASAYRSRPRGRERPHSHGRSRVRRDGPRLSLSVAPTGARHTAAAKPLQSAQVALLDIRGLTLGALDQFGDGHASSPAAPEVHEDVDTRRTEACAVVLPLSPDAVTKCFAEQVLELAAGRDALQR